MAQVKLALEEKDDQEIRQLAETHIAEMTGNTNFPTPSPDATAFAALLTTFAADLTAADQAAQASLEATQKKAASRAALCQGLTARGSYVQTTSQGNEAKILSAGFEVRDPSAPIGPMPAPEDFMPSMGDLPGEIDLTWSRVKGARTYVIEYKEQGATGAWAQSISTKSRNSIDGLTSGKTYVFRVSAVGAAGQGPWSLEAARMAP